MADVAWRRCRGSGAVTRDGKGETVAGMVIMLQGENGKDVATRVKAKDRGDRRRRCPRGMRDRPLLRPERGHRPDLAHGHARTSSRASLLVVAVLFFFLRDVRASLIVAAVIPLAMLAGFLGMRLFGVSANLMSLGAIDFGLIVDGAVVMMENFIRRRAERDPTGEPDFVADPASHRRRFFTSAATEVARPVLFGVLIIVAVYVPVFTLEGLEGKMFRPMAITVCSAILGALVLALTVRARRLLLPPEVEGSEHEERWFLRLRRYYVAHLEDAMNHPGARSRWRSRWSWSRSRRSRSSAPSSCRASTRGRSSSRPASFPSISLEESAAISTRVEQIVRRFPEVKQVVTKIGRPDVATEAMGIYQGDVYVTSTPCDEWKSGWSKEELIDHMAAALAEMPGVAFNFTQPMAMRLDEVVSGREGGRGGQGLRPRPGDPRAGGRGDPVASSTTVRGAADLQVEVLSGAAQVQIDVDRARIARYGLNVVGRARARGDGDRRADRHRDPRRPAAVRRRGALPGRACAATPSDWGSSS